MEDTEMIPSGVEMKKPAPVAVYTPRRRKSFGKKDVRKLHRRDDMKYGLKRWAKINSQLVLRMSEKLARPLSQAAAKIL